MVNIVIIGTSGCSNCIKVKEFAERNQLNFTYQLSEELDKEKRSELLQRARKKKIFAFPLILIDEELYTVQEFKNRFTKYVIKRDGRKVEFTKERIVNAILAAMQEAEETDTSVAEAIAIEIFNKIGKETSVEEIQDMVEKLLLKYEKDDTARKYITYRAEQKEKRKTLKSSPYEILTDDFVSAYKHKPDPMPQVIGAFTYYRTYSREIPGEKRKERWWETVRRAVEYNCKLMPTSKEEAQALFDLVYNLKGFLSGRTFWVGHTQVSYKYPMSNYNCAFAVVDSLEVFSDMFLLLMLGSGFGFRIKKDDVDKLPKVRKDINIIHKYYEGVERSKREDVTSLLVEKDVVTVKVGDSKEGWSQALKHYFTLISDTSYRSIKTIVFDYDHVRPAGERLRTFGGRASGHESLKTMFSKMDKVIKGAGAKDKSWIKLKPIDCLDIANIIGENVVSGGVRRTSEICVFDPDDEEVLDAKKDLYTFKNGEWIENKDLLHRRMSNNTMFFDYKPTREQLHKLMLSIRYNGEPGFLNAEAARKRRPNFNGLNPCGEILLDSEGLCNLVTNNVVAYVENGKLNQEALLAGMRLTARASFRMTCAELELHQWDLVQKRDRLLGVSVTGWQDMVDMVGLSREEEEQLLQKMRKAVRHAADEISEAAGVNAPLLTTTVKPEGTISLLPTVSSGVHYSHSPYYIRRIRISAHDPLLKICEELGYPIFPETGETEENCRTKVIEFPVKCGAKKTKYDVSAIEQLENYKMFMENYVEHNCSITVSVKDEEWEAVEQWLWDNWDDVVAITFLSLSNTVYPLMPYESITEEEYELRAGVIKPFKPSLISKYITSDEFDVTDADCVTGVCAVR